MEYIKVDLDIQQNFKFIRFKSRLNISSAAAVGHLTCLWTWAFRYAPDGFFDEDLEELIAQAAQWEGDPNVFLNALLTCGGKGQGFIEKANGGYVLHEWEEHCGKTYEKRAKEAERLRAYRAKKKDECARTDEISTRTSTNDVRAPFVPRESESEREKERENKRQKKKRGFRPSPPPPTKRRF
jgi:hypothetical protein